MERGAIPTPYFVNKKCRYTGGSKWNTCTLFLFTPSLFFRFWSFQLHTGTEGNSRKTPLRLFHVIWNFISIISSVPLSVPSIRPSVCPFFRAALSYKLDFFPNYAASLHMFSKYACKFTCNFYWFFCSALSLQFERKFSEEFFFLFRRYIISRIWTDFFLVLCCVHVRISIY